MNQAKGAKLTYVATQLLKGMICKSSCCSCTIINVNVRVLTMAQLLQSPKKKKKILDNAAGQTLHAPDTLCCWLQKQQYNARQSVPGYQEQLDCSVCSHTCGMASTCTRLGGNAHFLTIYWQFAIIAAEPHKVRHVDIFTPTKHNVTGGDVNIHRRLTSALAA